MWWSVPGKGQIYQHNKENLSYYSQRRRRYYLDETTDTCPLDLALSISMSIISNSLKIEGPAIEFILVPPMNTLSDFEDKST